MNEEDIKFLSNSRRTRYATLASMILLVYDHALTSRSEVDLVWFKTWTWSKVLFLWNRYGTFVILLFDTIVVVGGGPSDAFCLHWQKFQGWTGWLTNMTVEIIIQVRIAAMFSQDKRVIIPMAVLFFAQAIGMAVIIGIGFREMRAKHEPVAGFRMCTLDRIPSRMYIYWATNLAFETVLFGLALFKASQHFARRRGIRPDWSGPRILNVLVRDSILYFFVIFVTYVMNLVSWSTGGGGLYQLAISLAISLRASMGSRLLLNVREVYYGCDVVISENPLSSIQWQQPGTDCVVMDSFPNKTHQASTAFSTLTELERDWAPEGPQAGPSSTAQIKSRSRVTFDAPYTP